MNNSNLFIYSSAIIIQTKSKVPALVPIIAQEVKEPLPSPKACLNIGQCFKKSNKDECEFCSFYSVQIHTEDHLLGKRVGKNKRWVFRPVKLYSCSYCSQRVKSLGSLKIHEMFHLKKSNHQCPSCSYSVRTLNHLMKHLNKAHSDGIEMGPKDVNNDIFIDMVTLYYFFPIFILILMLKMCSLRNQMMID